MTQEALDEEVLEVLSTLILFKNKADAKGWRDAFENMPIYMERIGLTHQELNKLKVIHVAGTKGKGSTCAMIEAMLRQCGYKTGLYTSPHLVDVRERIRINGEMVSKEVFQSNFWLCYERFKETATAEVGVPGYFRFMTLLALKTFLSQAVDVVVLEVGVGGRLDATNVIPEPVVCGITNLGMDHMDMLGDTLPKIAKEKAGILKQGRPGFTVEQPADAMQALQESAQAVKASLQVAPTLDRWKPADGESVHVALGGEHQKINAGIAVQLCLTFEQQAIAGGFATKAAEERVQALQAGLLPAEYKAGLEAVQWPGRSQTVHDTEFATSQVTSNGVTNGSSTYPSSRLSFFIDGAHTPESMVTCAEWFAAAAKSSSPAPGTSQVERVLLFNCMKERDPSALLPSLSSTLAQRGIQLTHTVFVPPMSQYGFLPTKRKPVPDQAVAATASAAAAAAERKCQSGSSNSPSIHQPQPTTQAPPEFSWQQMLQQVWSSQCASQHAGGVPHPAEPSSPFPQAPGLPVQNPSTGAVASSMGAAIEWIRSMARTRPNLQLQVLVTGSLYLVGDVLRLLGKAPK